MVRSHQALIAAAGQLLLFGAVACAAAHDDSTGAGGAAAGGTAAGGTAAGGEGAQAGEPAAESAGAAGQSGSVIDGAFYATSVESFTPGEGAGYNADKFPDIVLGPPKGKGTDSGSLDVLSLGSGGEIVLGFGEHAIADGPGPDFVVFENAFWPGGDASQVFAELGEVSVSEDGNVWQTFACDTKGDGQGRYPGCAGYTPTQVFDANELVPLDPEKSGGDAFDLAELGVTRARWIKIRDLKTLEAGGTSSGFDLDAVGAIHVK
jgi:hypothetical protein